MSSTTNFDHNDLSWLTTELSSVDLSRVALAYQFVRPLYQNKSTSIGQDALTFAQNTANVLALLKLDVHTIIAGLLSELPFDIAVMEVVEKQFNSEVVDLIKGLKQLAHLREITASKKELTRDKNTAEKAAVQVEYLRKMLLSTASDTRVVLMRLACVLTSLRYFVEQKINNDLTVIYARETLDLYAPLANRLGVWQIKWELEDLAFRFLEPENYKRIAKMLEEKRAEREAFIVKAIDRLRAELKNAGIKADVSGRPKHIYSIWNKMRGKSLDFSELYDVRAFRVTVTDIKDCYAVLGIVHHIWVPITKEFDDYISRPKSNGYQSLHTVVLAEDSRAIEVQIRTQEMHNFAEYGVAAHWRYKEAGNSNFSEQEYDKKIAWLRQLLTWKNEAASVAVNYKSEHAWVEELKSTNLDDRIYVLTPQARVIELPNGATPLDFAYHLHTELGHRCRGARIDGAMVPLNTVLKNSQTVEIITAKGVNVNLGPSRDWLSENYLVSARSRSKVRAWFNAIDQEETLSHGRSVIEKILQREGKTSMSLEELARKLGFLKQEELFLSVGKDEFSLRSIEQVLSGDVQTKVVDVEDEINLNNKSRASSTTQGAKSGVLIVGTEGLLTQLAKCCRPAPPDNIVGFVTRGKGVSIHRATCKNFSEMRKKTPERVIQSTWGNTQVDTVYPVNIFILATDRQGLLRDILEIFSREKINVVGVKTQSIKDQAKMAFTTEVKSTAQLQKALGAVREISGVTSATRN